MGKRLEKETMTADTVRAEYKRFIDTILVYEKYRSVFIKG